MTSHICTNAQCSEHELPQDGTHCRACGRRLVGAVLAADFPEQLRRAVDALDWNTTADPGLVEHVKSVLQDLENMSDWSKAMREIVTTELMLPADEETDP